MIKTAAFGFSLEKKKKKVEMTGSMIDRMEAFLFLFIFIFIFSIVIFF